MKVRVKICGLKSVADVLAAQGADALGVIVSTPSSPRNLDLAMARKVLSAAPPGALKVAVTTAAAGEVLRRIVATLKPDVIQVHRELPPARWRRIRRGVRGPALWGLLGIGGKPEGIPPHARALREAPLDGVVLDTKLAGKSGGTGVPHDWGVSRRLRDLLRPLPVILAGGLTPQNVLEAIRKVEPDWIDLSSGVEEGGHKSPHKVAELLKKVRNEAE